MENIQEVFIKVLPTKTITNIIEDFGRLFYTKKIIYNKNFQHLFFISNEDIKENDWYIDDCNEIKQSFTSDIDYWNKRKDYKKIIASTFDLKWETIAIIPYLWIEEVFIPNQDIISSLKIKLINECKRVPNTDINGQFPVPFIYNSKIEILKDNPIYINKDNFEKIWTDEDMKEFAFNFYVHLSEIMKVPFNKISENGLHVDNYLDTFKKEKN